MSRIAIRYCVVWNYRPRAARVAEILQDEFKLDVDLVEGNRGEFTVWVDGNNVAKKIGDDFPPEEEVVTAVRKAIAA